MIKSIQIVGWAGRAVKGGKGIYSAAKGISTAKNAMSTYKNVQAFSPLGKTEMGICGMLSLGGLSEYTTGKDMFGNELTDQQRQVSLTQSIFAGLPFVPGMAKEAYRLGQQAINSTVQIGKQGADVTRAFMDDLGRSLNTSPNAAFAGGVGNIGSYLKAESRADVGKVSGDKSEYLSMLSGRGSGVVDAGKGTGNGNIVNEVKEIDFGKHIIKGENGKKQLLPNTKYVTNDNYKYTTDELGRIVNVYAPELVLKKANRNKYAQGKCRGKRKITR